MRLVFEDLIAGLGLKHKQRKDLRSLIKELEYEPNVPRGKVTKKLEQSRIPVFLESPANAWPSCRRSYHLQSYRV